MSKNYIPSSHEMVWRQDWYFWNPLHMQLKTYTQTAKSEGENGGTVSFLLCSSGAGGVAVTVA